MIALTPNNASNRLRGMKKTVAVVALVLCAFSCTTLPARMPETMMGKERPADRDQAAAYYHFMVGNLLEQESDYNGAQKEFEKAYSLDPKSAEISLSLAIITAHK